MKNKNKNPKRNPFKDVKDVYLTPNKIAVTITITTTEKRGYTKIEKTKYYKRNDSNMRKLKKARGDTVRVGRTGCKYQSI